MVLLVYRSLLKPILHGWEGKEQTRQEEAQGGRGAVGKTPVAGIKDRASGEVGPCRVS